MKYYLIKEFNGNTKFFHQNDAEILWFINDRKHAKKLSESEAIKLLNRVHADNCEGNYSVVREDLYGAHHIITLGDGVNQMYLEPQQDDKIHFSPEMSDAEKFVSRVEAFDKMRKVLRKLPDAIIDVREVVSI